MTQPSPDVSVVIAAKNESKFVAQAVLSIVQQEGVAHELVFVDDGSTDNTFDIVSEIAKQYPTLRVVRNPKAGKVSAFNYGVSLARGTWTCIFAGDDIMPQGSLAERWRSVKGVTSDKPIVGLCKLVTMSEIKSQDGHLVPKRPGQGGLTGTSYFMDKTALGKLFPVPEVLPNEDTWLELAASHFDLCLVHSDAIGCKWRVHSGNSINLLVGFNEFNRKLTPRMRAVELFDQMHGASLDEESRAWLKGKVDCEEGRRTGNVVRILRSRVNLVEKLRALSQANAPLYEIRRKFYGLLSGW